MLGSIMLLLNILFERLKIGPLWIFFFVWYVPVFISQDTELIFNKEWSTLTFFATQCVILGFLPGYILTTILLNQFREIRVTFSVEKNNFNLLFCAYTLSIIVVLAYIYLYISIGGPPLLSTDIGSTRKQLTEISPPIFSLAQLTNAFGCVYGVLLIKKQNPRKMNIIWIGILFILILSGWRNVILTYLIFTFTPMIISRRPGVLRFSIYLTLFLFLFSVIGYIRGDQGDDGFFVYQNAIKLLWLYVYPAFINFEILQTYEIHDFHFYTLQFILKPIYVAFEASLSPPQNALGAFNVATGLNPLYHDGGLVNIFTVFLIFGISLSILLKTKNKNIYIYFIISTIYSTFIFLHNGWFLLNYMFTYNIVALLSLLLIHRIATKISQSI